LVNAIEGITIDRPSRSGPMDTMYSQVVDGRPYKFGLLQGDINVVTNDEELLL
jgi:hypothetical protein